MTFKIHYLTDGLVKYGPNDDEIVRIEDSIEQGIKRNFYDLEGAVFFQRQLEHIKARSYDVKYADLKAREIFNVSNEAGPGATAITYPVFDQSGVANIINGNAQDLPRADVSGKEVTIPVKTIATSFGYTEMEVKNAIMAGLPLQQRRMNAARRAIEEKINSVAFFGDASANLPGLFSNSDIPTGGVVNGGSGTAWTTKTADQIVTDINDAFDDIFTASDMKETGNTVLLPPAQWHYIHTTARSANSDTTIAQFIVNNSPFGLSADKLIPVNECAAANNPLLGSDAMVVFNDSEEHSQLEIPREVESLATEIRGLEFVVPMLANIGGLNIYYPLAFDISTGI